MEGTVNKAAGLVFLLCRCGDRDFHVYLHSNLVTSTFVETTEETEKNKK